MLPVLQFLGFTIPVGPLFALLAFYAFAEVAPRAVRWLRADAQAPRWADLYSNAVFIGAIAGLIGARLGYAIRYAALYAADPRLLISIRPGTLSLWPGVLVAVVAAGYYLWRNQVPLTLALDGAGIGVSLGLAFLSVGQFLTGDGYGMVTDTPWGVELWGAIRHPVQLYLAAAFVLIFIVLAVLSRRARPGETFWRFVLLSGLAYLFLDAYRANSPTWVQGIRLVQVFGLAAMLGAMFVLSYYAQGDVKIED